jgi:hypothetical protein
MTHRCAQHHTNREYLTLRHQLHTSSEFKRFTAVALKLLVTPLGQRRKAVRVSELNSEDAHKSRKVLLLNLHFLVCASFLAGRILEVPLIVLQYYKPSFSLYKQ